MCLIGVFAGLLQSLLGIGGGAVIVPALVFLVGFPQRSAQAASLWYVVPTSLFAAILYLRGGQLALGYLRFVAAMAAASFVGSLLGVPLVKRIRQDRLKQIFGVALVGIALVMIWRTLAGNLVPIANDPKHQYLVLTWTGLIAGFLSSLLGIGGGVLVVPALVLLGGIVDQKTAQGISLAYVVPAGLFSAFLYHFHTRILVHVRRALLMILGGLCGSFAGWHLVAIAGNLTLRVIFAAGIAVLGIVMVTRVSELRAPDWVI